MCQERLQRVRELQAQLLSEPNRSVGASPEGVVPSKGLTNFHPFCLDLFSFHLLRVSLLKRKGMRYYASSEPGGEHVPGTKQAWSFGEFIIHDKKIMHGMADYEGEGLMIMMLVMMMMMMMMVMVMMMVMMMVMAMMMMMMLMMMMMIMMMRVIMIGMIGMVG